MSTSKASFLGGEASSRANSSSNAPGPLPLFCHHDSLEWALSSQNYDNNARHRTDYEHIRILGRGGFGTTHLVRNIVDSRMYALKCIRLGSGEQFGTDACKRVLREVDALSSLKSDNVVRYYGAWVERGEMESDDASASTSPSDSHLQSLGGAEDYSDTTNHDDVLLCTCNLCNDRYVDWEISYEQWGLIDSVLQPLNLCVSCYKKSIPHDVDASSIVIRERRHVLPECLYILMEYAGTTLSDENEDASGSNQRRWTLFGQCVQGLECIHEKGIIHRDLKPSNIFVKNDIATIGDLGLASYRSMSLDAKVTGETDTSSALSGSSPRNAVSADVGTYLYTAPEVQAGQYDEKADIYSLGIVLIELFSNFQTGMERANVLSKIRTEGDVPKDWATSTDPAVVELARLMILRQACERPSCTNILEYLVQHGLLVNPEPNLLLGMVKSLRHQVDELERTVAEKERESEYLRKMLAEHGIDDVICPPR